MLYETDIASTGLKTNTLQLCDMDVLQHGCSIVYFDRPGVHFKGRLGV